MTAQAFEGLKVLEFSTAVTGPLVTKYLAEHGATVVRVESRRKPDILRISAPYKDGRVGWDTSAYFTIYNPNKFSINLNLQQSEGVEVAKRLVHWCDIVVENFTPGVMEKLGLSYREMKKIKPDLIMLRSSNQGQTGPTSHVPGYGYTLSSLCGFTSLTGWNDREPCHPFGALSDLFAPGLATIVLIAALEYRRHTGKGQCLDVSQYECSLYLLSPMLLDYVVNGREFNRMGNRSYYSAPHGAYPCKGEDRWCVIACDSDEDWLALCKVIGKPELASEECFGSSESRKENEDKLDTIVAEWTKERTPEEVMVTLQEAKIAAGVVKNSAELFEDTQLHYRKYFEILKHPEIGYHSYQRSPFRLSLTPGELTRPAPCLGEHTESICRELLGMREKDFMQMMLNDTFE